MFLRTSFALPLRALFIALICATTLGSCFNSADVIGFVNENALWRIDWNHDIESLCTASSDQEIAWMVRLSGKTFVRLRFAPGQPVELLPISDTAVTVNTLNFTLHANCDRNRHSNATIVSRPAVSGGWRATGSAREMGGSRQELTVEMVGRLVPGRLAFKVGADSTLVEIDVAEEIVRPNLRFSQIEHGVGTDTIFTSAGGGIRTRTRGVLSVAVVD